jgi:hypothetical protein
MISSIFPLSRINSEQYSPIFVRCFVLSIFILFTLANSPINFVERWYDTISSGLLSYNYLSADNYNFILAQKTFFLQLIIVPVRTLLLFLSLGVIFYPLFEALKAFSSESKKYLTGLHQYRKIIYSFAVLCLLIFPTQLGLGGNIYAKMSFDPLNFNDTSLWFYQRILMPSIAYFLQMRGPLLYYVFSLWCTLLLLWLVSLFFLVRGIELSFLELLSIGTSSFIMTQLQSPGYTEQLSYIFIVLFFIVPTDTYSRLSVVVLSMLSHEISAVVIAFIALLFFTKNQRIMTGIIILLYVGFWLGSFGFHLSDMLHVRNVHGMSGLAWALKYPMRQFIGILLSFKMLWIIVFISLYYMKTQRTLLLGFMLIGLFFTYMGVDTSRLMGFGFISLLFSFYWIKKYSLLNAHYVKYILAGNIMIPSFYIGTNVGPTLINGVYSIGGGSGVVIFNGLYQILYFGVLFR